LLPEAITEDVLAAARQGSGDAFAVIWRELSPVVHGYLATRGASDPEGLTSDVFVALLPRLRELTGGVGGLRTFVFSVAHARSVDEIRKRARQPNVVEFDQLLHDSTADSAEHDALEQIGTDRVQELLDRLSPDHREVLALRVVADLSVEQTAVVMRRSIGSIKQLQRRALIALRAHLTDDPANGVTGKHSPSITDTR
jgi:RNA polymerase sigma-70 factor (ECF subfamily)